jgi:hypothetical protein
MPNPLGSDLLPFEYPSTRKDAHSKDDEPCKQRYERARVTYVQGHKQSKTMIEVARNPESAAWLFLMLSLLPHPIWCRITECKY